MTGKVPDPENHAAKGLWTASEPGFAKSPLSRLSRGYSTSSSSFSLESIILIVIPASRIFDLISVSSFIFCKSFNSFRSFESGGRDGIRTHDLLIANSEGKTLRLGATIT
jgi:hypothetical protein